MALDWNDGLPADVVETDPAFVILYGGPKTGKTTLGSEFPSPLYVRTGKGERPPAGVVMKSFGVSETYEDIVEQIDWMLEAEHDRKTFLLDAADGLELLIRSYVCKENKWASIEDPGYGKGYTAEQEIWADFIGKLLKLKEAGFYVVIISHVKVKTEPGVTTDSYPRYRLNLRDDAMTILTSNADLVGYVHQRVSIKKEDAGFKKTNTRGEGGGEVVIAVQERPGYIAGNRYNIQKPTLPYKRGEGFKALKQCFDDALAAISGDGADE